MSDELGIVNKPPYFDDFDASKNYAKILFRPGRAIQSRELTQIQTTIQHGIASLGDKLLSSPVVSGGDFKISTVKYLRFYSDIDPSFLKGKLIIVGSGGTTLKVLHLETASDEAQPNNYTLFFEYKSGSEMSFSSLTPSSNLSIGTIVVDEAELEQANYTITVRGFDTTGLSSTSITGLSIYGDVLLARLGEGVFYKKGYFLVTDETLTLPLSTLKTTEGGYSYTNYIPELQNTRVGLKLLPKYITTAEDPTLFDPSAGYYNFAAPGADRLQLFPELVQISENSSEDVIELVDIIDGDTRVVDPILVRPTSEGLFDDECGGDKILKPFILDIIGNTLNINSGRAVVNCTDIEIIENQTVSLVKTSDNKRLFSQAFNDQCLSDAIIVQSNAENPLFSGVAGSNFSSVNTNYFGSGKIRKLFSDEAVRLEIVSCDGIKIGCLTVLDIEKQDSTSYRIYYNELQSYSAEIPVTSLFAEACLLSLDGEQVFSFGSSIPLTCSDTTPGGARRLVYSVPRGSNLKSIFDADYMITRDFIGDIKTNISVPYYSPDNPSSSTILATAVEFNMDIPNGVFNDRSSTPNVDMFIFSINGKVVPVKNGTNQTPYFVRNSDTKVTLVLDSTTSPATDESGNPLTIPTAGKCYMITKVRFPEKSSGTPSENISPTPIPHRKKRLREARGAYTHDFSVNPSLSLGFSDVYVLKSVKDALGVDITSRFVFDDGQRNDRYDHASISLMNPTIDDAGEKEYTVEFRYFQHDPIAPGFYGPITINSYGFDQNGQVISGFHGTDLNGAQMTLRYDEIPNFLDRVSGEVVSLADAVDFRMIRTEEGLIENGENKSSILRGRWFPSPQSSAAVEASYRLDLPRIDLLVLRQDASFVLLEGEPATNPVPPEYPKDGCVIAEINVPGTVVSSEDFIVQKPPIKEIGLPELNDMQSRIANLEKALSIQTLENKARVQSAVLNNEFLTGMVVDDFGGHYIGDVSNDEYNCSMDFSRGTLRAPFSTKFIDFVPNYGSYSYPKTEESEANYFVMAPSTGNTSVISNDQGTSDITVNSFNTTDWHGYLSFDRPYQLWIDQTTKPVVRNNLRGQNDAWEAGGQAVQIQTEDGTSTNVSRVNGFGTQWAFWKSIWFGDTLLGNTTFEKDRASAKAFSDEITNTAPARFSRSIDRDALFAPTRKTIGNGGFGLADGKTNRYVDSSLSFFSPENYIIVRGYGLKPSTVFSVYFENMTIPVSSGRILNLQGSVLSQVSSDDSGKVEFVLYIPNGSYITGNKVVKIVENTSTTKPSFASGIYSNNGAGWKDIAESDDDTVDMEFLPIGRGDVLLKNERTLYSSETPANGIYQKFFIDSGDHPYGLVLDRIGVYFSQLDETTPISVEIRKVRSGRVDSHRIIRNSRVEIVPSSSGYSDFVFTKPVYLSAGEYALCIRSDSGNYKVHVSQRGLLRVDSTASALEEESFASSVFGTSGFFGGSAFSQLEDTSTTLRFYIKRKVFATGQTSQTVLCRPNRGMFGERTIGSERFDLLHFANDNWRTTVGDVDYELTTDNGTYPISSNTDIEGSDSFNASSQEQGIRIRVVTQRDDVSPIVDMRRFGLLLVKNHISKTLDCLPNETLSFGGSNGSAFKYISRRTDIALPANVLRSTIEGMIPSDLDVRMFAKVLYEGELDFDNKEYIEMNRISGSPSIYRDRFGEMVFEMDLTDRPNNFVSFAVKLIITSNNTETATHSIGFYPELRNLTVVSSVR